MGIQGKDSEHGTSWVASDDVVTTYSDESDPAPDWTQEPAPYNPAIIHVVDPNN